MIGAGFTPVLAVELDPAAAKSYKLNHPKVDVMIEDVASLSPAKVRENVGLKPGELAVLNACPPCQGFSSLHRGTASGDRNDLVLQVIRWASAMRPKVVLLENVPGLERDHRFARVLRGLRGLGYGAVHWMIDAADIGVPQHRRRLIMVAVRNVSKALFPSNIVAAMPRSWRRRRSAAPLLRDLESAAEDGDDLQIHRKSSPIVAQRIASIPQNGNRFDLPPELELECHRRVKTRSATGPYARVPTVGPAGTMTTRCTTPSCGPFVHPSLDRGLTLREAAILQTFPRRYRFFGRYQQIEVQVGNAIPPMLTRKVLQTLQRWKPNGPRH